MLPSDWPAGNSVRSRVWVTWPRAVSADQPWSSYGGVVPVLDGAGGGADDDGGRHQVEQQRLPPKPRFGRLAARHVADRGGGEGPVRRLDRAEADRDRELGAILAPPEQLQPGTHGPRMRVGHVGGPMARVRATEALGEEEVDDWPSSPWRG